MTASALAKIACDKENQRYWNELCGTHTAQILGITDYSPASLKKFDDWYFNFYPYLGHHIPFTALNQQKVLEVGLGYGAVSARLAGAGAQFTGLDVADGPVDLVNLRLRDNGLAGQAVQGSILAAPFADNQFDVVIAIGCLHHTGDMAQAVREVRRILRPGGQLICMVYYAYSYRCWSKDTASTFHYLLWDKIGFGKNIYARQREAMICYDQNNSGEMAPFTEFASRSHFRRLLGPMQAVNMRLENICHEGPLRAFSRERLLATPLPRLCGLDLYVRATNLKP